MLIFKKCFALTALMQVLMLSSVNAESILDKAEKFAVRVKASIGYPFAEDKAGRLMGLVFYLI